LMGVFRGRLVPASTLFELHKMRWGICSEELCFDNPRQATMFGMGRCDVL
jgi:hypothetical protein